MNEELNNMKWENVNAALEHKEGSYVPTIAFPGPAAASWAGKTACETLVDPDTYAATMTKVFEDMWCDCTIDHGLSTTPNIEKAFHGNVQNKFAPDGTTVEHLQNSLMKSDEYPQLIENTESFVVDVLLPRKFPWLFENKEEAKKALKILAEQQYKLFFDYGFALYGKMQDEYGVTPIVGETFVSPCLDLLFDSFRGFSGMLTDLRRKPKEVLEAVDKLWYVYCEDIYETPMENPFPFAEEMPHMPAYLSPKQFDEFYWPQQKKWIDKLSNDGSKLVILFEGKWKHVWDRFKDVAKDSVIIMCDDDDIFELNEALGDHHIITGGTQLAKIRLDSKENNINRAKAVIDACAPGGGFMYGTDKNWISPGDINQNLIDVYNFAHEYGRY